MRFFYGITSAFLAILIASPLCCCFAEAATDDLMPQVSCCSLPADTNQDVPAPGSCPGCQAKNPRLADGGKSVILPVVLSAVALVPDFVLVLVASETSSTPVNATVPLPGARPPRLLLIFQQRFLI